MSRRVRWFLLAGCACVCALYAPTSGRLALEAYAGPYANDARVSATAAKAGSESGADSARIADAGNREIDASPDLLRRSPSGL